MNSARDDSSWNGGAGRRDTADVERHGDQIRADMDRTLDEIERTLSPGALLDRSMQFAREHGSELMREAGETIRSNPVPVLLTAVGAVWLTASIASSRRSAAQSGTNRRDSYYQDETGSSSMDYYNSEQEVSSQQKLGRAKDWVKERTQGVGSQLVQLVRDQPVALGALALAAGALLGAAIPMTRYENRMAGPLHDRAARRLKQAGRQQYEKVRDAMTSEGDGSGRDQTAH